jgi:pimeloyl-ACP methyl ester carboxylesterase
VLTAVSGKCQTRLHVTLSGPRDAHPWLLLHGYGDGSYVWSDVVERFSGTCSLAAIDLTGHGLSYSRSDAAYTTEATIEDVISTVNALGVRSFSVVGHSWGGAIALHLAARLPERIRGVVAVDCSIERNEEAVRHVRRELRESLRGYRTVCHYAQWLAQRRPLASPSVITKVAAAATRARSDGMLERAVDPALAAFDPGGDTNLCFVLARVQAEVLLIRGAMSGTVSAAMAHTMASQLKSVRLKTVARAGHSVMIDNPAGFNDAIEPFLAEISAPSASRSL